MYLPTWYVAEIVRLGNGPWLPYSAKLNLHIPFHFRPSPGAIAANK